MEPATENKHIDMYRDSNPPAEVEQIYSKDEVVQNFLALLESLDFRAELSTLGISSFSLFRKNREALELNALAISLWGLALEKSFPIDGQEMYNSFFTEYTLVQKKKKEAVALLSLAQEYREMLTARGDTDFSAIATHLADKITFGKGGEEVQKRHKLRLILYTRTLYKLIFDRLI